MVEDIISLLRTEKFVGVFDSIAEPESFEAIAKIVNTLGANVKISSVLPYDKPTETFAPKYGKFLNIHCLFLFLDFLLHYSLAAHS